MLLYLPDNAFIRGVTVLPTSMCYSSDQWYLKSYKEYIPTLLHVPGIQLPAEKKTKAWMCSSQLERHVNSPLFSNLNRIYGSNLELQFLHLSYLLKLCMIMFTKSLFNRYGFNLDAWLQRFFQNINDYSSEEHQASLSVSLLFAYSFISSLTFFLYFLINFANNVRDYILNTTIQVKLFRFCLATFKSIHFFAVQVILVSKFFRLLLNWTWPF